MLQTASTSRNNHSNRFKRCESDQTRTARSQRAQLRPFFPVLGLTPSSPCPHGAKIHDGDVCMVKHCASNRTQHDVDATPAPPPVNIEDRTAQQIWHLESLLASDMPARDLIGIRERIKDLKAEVKRWSGNPTTFAQTQRGGNSSVKVKSLWKMAGTTDKVQAHTKSEARALFKHLLGIPSHGRLPIGAALSKVVA